VLTASKSLGLLEGATSRPLVGRNGPMYPHQSRENGKTRINPVGGNVKHVSCSDCLYRSSQLFCNLPADTQQTLDRIKHVVLFSENTILYREGSRAGSVCVLCTGKIKLSLRSPGGRSLAIRTANPGEVLGLSACLAGDQHQVTAETIEKTQIAIISREDLLLFLQQHIEACIRVLCFLSEGLGMAYYRVRSIDLGYPLR
jgi:CRP-like cAMP-binding protein